MSFETECFSMNSDMSKRISDFSLPNRNWASARATSVLPTPVGPRNRNDPAGREADFKPPRQRRDSLLLADDAPVQLVFDAQQLGLFLFLDGGHGHAGPAGHHVLNVFLGHDANGAF